MSIYKQKDTNRVKPSFLISNAKTARANARSFGAFDDIFPLIASSVGASVSGQANLRLML